MEDASESLDQAAINRVLDGDTNAFSEIYLRYLGHVRRIGLKILRGKRDADDYVQDVFVKTFAHLKDYSGAGTFHAWLGRIAFTTALNHRRKVLSETLVDLADIEFVVRDASTPTPELQQIARDALRVLRSAIRSLPGHYARVVEMVSGFHLKYCEIADITGIPVGTLKAQYHRAKRLLKRALSGTIAEAMVRCPETPGAIDS